MRLPNIDAEDIFISYSRKDSIGYAEGLKHQLESRPRPLACFIDKLYPQRSPTLPEFVINKVKTSRMLVIIGTEPAGKSEAIEQELKEYISTNKTALVVIKFDDTIYGARWYPLIKGIALEPENDANALSAGKPSTSVVDSIVGQYKYARRYQRLRRAIVIATIVFLVLVAFGVAAGVFANRKVQQLTEFESRRVQAAKRLYDAQGLVQVGLNPVSLTSDGPRIWVANSGDHTLQAIEAATGIAAEAITIDRTPGALSFIQGKLWIANFQNNSVQIVDPNTGQVTRTLTVDQGPIAFTYDGKRVWVLNRDAETVQGLNAAGDRIEVTTKLPDVPSAIAFDGTNLWVAIVNTASLQKLDPSTGAIVGTTDVGLGPRYLAFDGRYLWTSDDVFPTVAAIDPRSGTIAKKCESRGAILALNTGNNRLWITTKDNSITEINTDTCELSRSRFVGQLPLAILDTGNKVWIANNGDNSVSAMSPLAARVSEPIDIGFRPRGLRHDFGRLWIGSFSGQPWMTVLDPSNPSVRSPANLSDSPAAVTSDGSKLWSASQRGLLAKIDPETLKVIPSFDVMAQTVAITFDGKRLWVLKLRTYDAKSKEPISIVQPIDKETGELGNLIEIPGITYDLLFDGTRLWVAGEELTALNPETGAHIISFKAGYNLKLMCFDGKRLWVASGYHGKIPVLDTLQAFDPATGTAVKTIDLKVSALLFDGHELWVAEPERNAVRPINVDTFELGLPISVSRDPRLLAFDGQRLWVGNNDSQTLQSIRIRD